MYDYQVQQSHLFTEEGLAMFTKIRDNVFRLIRSAGAVRLHEATVGVSGDSWDMLACFDLMVERGDLREITLDNVPGQDRVFVAGKEGD